MQQQAELDSITFLTVSACLRQTAARITPLLHTLYFRNPSLAALECCATLEALAQEVEQDDVQTVHERAREAARPYYSDPV
ncbi:hypothetical protein OQ252_11955 [Acetobacter farinalis]|uniref:Uncharacterized protein n=1 Tax=Acetobacter farinalis TaxID=1260984 RepID=A0ABT3QA00_9PROT|nr:hypothetical protein [Acetobacter farinalis]MCX2562103.1 hypothetical protein [Acetobacter farinalis]NHO30725.1 hypothetical protein [Acetobacter farinalis]